MSSQDDSSMDIAATAVANRFSRHAQAKERLSHAGRLDWPPVYDDPFPGLKHSAVPEIDAAELTVDILGGAVAHHGLLLVRGLFTSDQVVDSRLVLDRVKAASQLAQPDESGWYVPWGQFEKAHRRVAENRGTNWLADSPRGLDRMLEHLRNVGLIEVLGEHFQERPVFSLQKSVLRTVQPETRSTGWHQDGSFLGDDVRAMNVWVALSHCGGSAPASGMELIPQRIEEIYKIDPSIDNISISLDTIADLKREHPTVSPEFNPGDALLFDEHLLHRTQCDPGLTAVRYALECWFFAPSHATSNYVPFLA